MSVRKPWDDEARKKAIQAFRKHYPNWSIVSNYSKCPNPKCGRQNFCPSHRYAYEEWLGSAAGVPLLALKDPKLKAEFKNGILKGHCPPEPIFDPLSFEGEGD